MHDSKIDHDAAAERFVRVGQCFGITKLVDPSRICEISAFSPRLGGSNPGHLIGLVILLSKVPLRYRQRDLSWEDDPLHYYKLILFWIKNDPISAEWGETRDITTV